MSLSGLGFGMLALLQEYGGVRSFFYSACGCRGAVWPFVCMDPEVLMQIQLVLFLWNLEHRVRIPKRDKKASRHE